MFKRLRQFFIRRKNKNLKPKYFSPPPSVYKKEFDFPPEPEPSMPRTPRMSIISIEDCSHLFESNFQLSRIPTFQIRSESGWQSSKPYSQNATRFRFHGSYNRFNSSRCSNQGGTPRRTTPKLPPPTQSTPRRRVHRRPHRSRYPPHEFNQTFDFSN